MLLDLIQIRNQVMYDLSPSLVEGLIPDRGSEWDGVEGIGFGSDEGDTVVVEIFALVGNDQIHLVNQDVYARSWGKLIEGSDDGSIGEKVPIEISGFDVENVDEDSDVREDVLPLLCEVVLHECILPGELFVSWCSESN